jgi:hypothetical protein
MEATEPEIEQLLERLAMTPHRLASISRGIDDERLHFKPDETAWSANDILAHLRAGADVWGKSVLAMIAQDHPTLRYVSPRTWIRKTNYPQQGFHESLQAYTRQRNELLEALRALDITGWSRGATFTATIKGREHTVLSYVHRIADHEREHSEQLEALLK